MLWLCSNNFSVFIISSKQCLTLSTNKNIITFIPFRKCPFFKNFSSRRETGNFTTSLVQFVNRVILSQNCKFQWKPRNWENYHASANKSKIILCNIPPPPPVIKSHILISLCYQFVSTDKKTGESKVLFGRIMDLPLIVLIIESSFLHFNMVWTKTNIDGSTLQIEYIPRYTEIDVLMSVQYSM